jgi:hypothetical protein
MGENLGEGMAAGALECILIEHLEATIQGKIYSEPRSEEENAAMAANFQVTVEVAERLTKPFRYASSASLFESFLTSREPFRQHFNKRAASVFYRKVRCGLLHEAATKDQTLVRKESREEPNKLVEMLGSKNLILYRSPFLRGIEATIDWFDQELSSNPEQVVALARKLDEICQIPKVFYFGYGRNLKRQVLCERAGSWLWAQPATLDGYSVTFNKRGLDGSKANLNEAPHGKVWGVCYELDETGFEQLKKHEGGYELQDVLIKFPSAEKAFIATTFVATAPVEASHPSDSYLKDIIEGAQDWQLPADYIQQIRAAAVAGKT